MVSKYVEQCRAQAIDLAHKTELRQLETQLKSAKDTSSVIALITDLRGEVQTRLQVLRQRTDKSRLREAQVATAFAAYRKFQRMLEMDICDL